MCGICGHIDLLNRPVPEDRIRGMCAALTARGPDDVGLHLEGVPADGLHLGLGHRRLSIIDLSSAARQPMTNEDGTIRLTYNGEIYNYKELRRELEAKGHRFRSDSDTEVVVHLYEEEGVEAVRRLNGMFAFGLWDETPSASLALPRPHRDQAAGILLGRRAPALRLRDPGAADRPLGRPDAGPRSAHALPGLQLRAGPADDVRGDPQARARLLARARRRSGGDRALLEPAAALRWARNRWAATGRGADWSTPLSEAVADCMLADVPVGAFLSGGVDSGIVVALMARLSSAPVKTFTIGFAGDGLYDETEGARRVAAMYGTEHHEFRIRQRDMLDALPEVLGASAEPFADSSAIPTYLVARETRRHVKVALSGDGGDELFGGYRSYLAEGLRARYHRVPALLRESVIEPVIAALPDSRETRVGETLRRVKKFIRAARGPFDERLLALKEIAPAHVRSELLKGGGNGPDPALVWVRQLLGRSPGDAVNRMLGTDLIDSLPGDMLTKVDLMSMAHSLEVRVPLLDHRVVELAFRIPGAEKLRGGVTKRVLKEACEGLLPPGHTRRPKAGFEIPISRWLRTDLGFLVDRYLSEERIRDQGIFEADVVQDLVRSHRQAKTDTAWALWNLIVFQKWHESHG